MIIIIPLVNKLKPNIDFFVNFSFKIRYENSIVKRIDNFEIEFTAI